MPISDMILAACQVLWFLWPVMFLAALEGGLKRRGKWKTVWPRVLARMLGAWGLVACARLILLQTGTTSSALLPEPLFWASGAILGAMYVWRLGKERRIARQQMKTASGLEDLWALSPAEFEHLVGETYRSFGYRVEVVAAQGDHGVDLVLHGSNGEKRIVQCKNWKGRVGEPVVRDLYGAMQHEGAVEGALVTSGTFTRQAREWAHGKPIQLYDGESFLGVLERARQNKGEHVSSKPPAQAAGQATARPVPQSATAQAASFQMPFCPQCGVQMKLRTARQGEHQGKQFWGCVNYPKCRVVIPAEA